MLKTEAEVIVGDVSRRELYEFMLFCTDADYQEWWPGTHLEFHTVRCTFNNIGNQVFFDEYVGDVRLRFYAVITELQDSVKIVWQLKKLVRLPVWLAFELEDHPDGVLVRHSLSAGFSGPGRILDGLLKKYLSDGFIQLLDEHAHTEFPMLAELLAKRRAS